MTDDDLDLDVEESDETPDPTASAPDQASFLQKQLEKARKENQGLRQRLRRTELEAKYPEPVVNLTVESGLPIDRWAEYAEKVAALAVVPAPEPQAEPETEEPPQVDVPPGLVAAQGSPAPGAAPARSELSPKQILELAKRGNAAEAMKAIHAQYRE